MITADGLEALRARMPELPTTRSGRLQHEYGVTPEHAHVLTLERSLAEFFEDAVRAAPAVPPRLMSNWITGDFLRIINETGATVQTAPVSAERLAQLVELVHVGEISGAAGKQVLEEMNVSGEMADEVVDRLNLRQVSDVDELERLVREVLEANPKLVADYQRGKTNTIQALVGRGMKVSKGKAPPQIIRDLLEKHLG
jgi:aspartyl-tRNA(Asn)/glutamyl-tRNA(Gln) amidotransferase subunit B